MEGSADTIGRLLTTAEVAAMLHIHVNTVRKWSDSGLLLAYRVGPRRDRRFHLEDVRKFPWAEREVGPSNASS